MLETNVETSIGKVETEEHSIDVYVTCMPAQFWKFDILCLDSGKQTIIETGSGSFTLYWNVAELIGRNIITVKSQFKSYVGTPYPKEKENYGAALLIN
jgi:hypothetical protein